MRNTTEAIWIFSFIFLYSALSFFFIKQILKKRKLKKEQEQHEEIKRAKQRKLLLGKLICMKKQMKKGVWSMNI